MVVKVVTGSRLHFGFRNLCLEKSHVYGGIGVCLENPKLVLTAERKGGIICEDENAKKYVQKSVEILGVEGAKVEIEEKIPSHVGLGSGTQSALAIYTAIAEVYGIEPKSRECAPKLGRGERSGVGVASFEQGGFNIDEGQETDSLTRGRRGIKKWKVPNEKVNLKIPKDWVFVVVKLEIGEGYSGNEEKKLINFVMKDARPDVTKEIDQVIDEKLIPSVHNGNCVEFGFAVEEISRLNGTWYEKYQGGIYRPPIGEMVNKLQDNNNIFGVGQSSWGPSLYSVTSEEYGRDVENNIQELLDELEIEGTIIKASPRNKGAEVT